LSVSFDPVQEASPDWCYIRSVFPAGSTVASRPGPLSGLASPRMRVFSCLQPQPPPHHTLGLFCSLVIYQEVSRGKETVILPFPRLLVLSQETKKHVPPPVVRAKAAPFGLTPGSFFVLVIMLPFNPVRTSSGRPPPVSQCSETRRSFQSRQPPFSEDDTLCIGPARTHSLFPTDRVNELHAFFLLSP